VETDELVNLARGVAAEIAPSSAEVDRDARFPHEAVAVFRRTGLLGALVPRRWGGLESGAAELARAIAEISRACASSGVVLAMHSIQVGAIARHAHTAAQEQLLPRLAAGELLLANANSEEGFGGDRRRSACALEAIADGFRLEKKASTASYAEHADGVTATARRSPDSAPSDQVLAICLPPKLEVEPSGDWDSLGLRGTCSRPCLIRAELPAEMVIDSYGDALTRTTLPLSALLLGAVWWGLAEEAAARAHASVRAAARRDLSGTAGTASSVPSSKPLRLAEIIAALHEIRQLAAGAAADYDQLGANAVDPGAQFVARMNALKVSITSRSEEVVSRSMRICGLGGYVNSGSASVARLLRDVTAGPLMVDNDRALLANADLLLMRRQL